MKMRSALVVGGDGLIGHALTADLITASWHVTCTSRRENLLSGWLHFDLKDGVDTLPHAVVQQADVVFLCAAVTGFATCANDPEASRHINVTRSVELGRRFMQNGAHVVYLSSNAVFNGTQSRLDEFAPTNPVTEYGRQKAECEATLLYAATKLPGDCAVVRLTKVVDSAHPLYSGWVQSFKKQAHAKAATDLIMCPVTTAYVASGLRSIGSGTLGGVYHLSGERDMTYYELATSMASLFGQGNAVEGECIHQRLGPVPSPTFCALSMEHTTQIFGIEPQLLIEVASELSGNK
jgi:dTDP-4-dehydrorhamnose reductase